MAHEVLHIHHLGLDIRADGFLVGLQGLNGHVPLVLIMQAVRGFLCRLADSTGGQIIGEIVFIHKLPDIRGHFSASAAVLGLILEFAAPLEHVGDFLLFGLSPLDLLDVTEGRILGRGGQFHLELGENEVDACARAEAAYTGDTSRTAVSADWIHISFSLDTLFIARGPRW